MALGSWSADPGKVSVGDELSLSLSATENANSGAAFYELETLCRGS